MKNSYQVGLSLGALVLAFCALLLSILSFSYRSMPQEQDVVSAPIAQAPPAQDPLQQEQHVYVERGCWGEGVYDGCVPNVWSWEGYDGKTYLIRLGEIDSDGEIRHLLIKDSEGRVVEVGELPQSLSYVGSFAEGEATLDNLSPTKLAKDGGGFFLIEVYESDVPTVLGGFGGGRESVGVVNPIPFNLDQLFANRNN